MITNNSELFATINELVESWCDRRCLNALRAILKAWPPIGLPLTDSWHELLVALQDVRAFARGETTEAEKTRLDECILVVDRMLRDR